MAAELPRCANCRTGIAAGENVVLRSDGRVEHVACPDVTCPVCARPITPGEPIRRDGELLLHGNCWPRRIRTITAVPDDSARRAIVIRAKLAAGALPTAAPTKTWGGYGDGHACDACGDRIAVGKLEYMIDFLDDRPLRVHPECLGIWQAARAEPRRGISGGSAASPCTLIFDLRIARKASRDRTAHAELAAAAAESVAAAVATRATSRAVRAQSAALKFGTARVTPA
jgi:hypothetical protein